jgi:hypothetical protein
VAHEDLLLISDCTNPAAADLFLQVLDESQSVTQVTVSNRPHDSAFQQESDVDSMPTAEWHHVAASIDPLPKHTIKWLSLPVLVGPFLGRLPWLPKRRGGKTQQAKRKVQRV